MNIQIKSGEIWLLLIVSLMALGANLPANMIGNVVDHNLLLIALVVTVFISLFRYLKFMLFLTVSVLSIGANLPDQLAVQLEISRTVMIFATGVLVIVALLYKLYYRQKSISSTATEAYVDVESTTDMPTAVSYLRDTMESRTSVLTAINSGDFAALHQLLISDVEVNFSQEGNIPIFVAIEKGIVDIVLLLLIHGAKLKIKNRNGLTPTEFALKLRFARIAKLLHYAETQNMSIQDRAVYSSQQKRKVAVLFADICDSTALYDQLGNDEALNMVTRTLNLLKQEVAKHKGSLIKTIGDEIMCTFPNALWAAQAARAMHQVVEDGKPGGEQIIAVRVGLHFGDVILKANDVFGDTVNVAARITSITRARQILTTQEVVDALPTDFGHTAIPITRAEFRGKQDSTAVFQIPWETSTTVSKRFGDSTLRRLKDKADAQALASRSPNIT
ncbi:MAG: hypothetical protein HOO97_06925 [Sideroxydans sp.]|nr:hypothetical protein [Sideroxydans sp.]NOT98811.1 hypothetical protein [Sideroxydans sp.]